MQVQNPYDLTLRPIIAGPNCVASRLSNLMDILLKPYVAKVSSYIRDGIDFLSKLKRTIKNTEILVSCNITNMYTNIDNELGMLAMNYWLDRYPFQETFAKEFVTEGVVLILENNTSTLDKQNYLKIRGTAM